jgi:ribosomal protein S18 acetylase RimI-like enzyme
LTGPAYTVRPARAADAEGVAAMWQVMADQHRAYDPQVWCWADDARGHWLQSFLRHLDADDMVCLVAEDDAGELAGFLVACVKDSPAIFSSRRMGEVWDLLVRGPHRGRGVGKTLVAAALDALRDRGAEGVILHVALDNPEAVGLYRALGLRPVMYRMFKKL